MLHLRGRLRVPRFPNHGVSQFRQHLSSLSSAQPQTPPVPPEPIPRPSSLSARMNFVFDQIDAIERERSQKDQTLQRIRAWRESKKNPDKEIAAPAPPAPERKFQEFELAKRDESVEKGVEENVGLLGSRKEVELVHPWPEWIEFMERLVQQNYFDHKRKDEEGMIENLGFNLPEMVEEEGFDFTRDFKTVQTAVLNFGKDRFDVMRSLSRQDLQLMVGYGCPSADKKVVFSSKLLRKHVHLDEGDVCSSCSLRSTCERAYLITNKEDEARTIDVVRVLLAYGFDAVNGSVTNKSLLKMKPVKSAVRKLIRDVVRLSAVPIDPNLPPPIIKKPPPKVKQPPPTPRKRVGRDDVEMKKGDWLCAKCDFMNFAKNTMCLQCDANRPKRQLLPGEWECPQCNFLNYRRNTVCFHCDHKRPPEEFVENPVQERQHSHRRLEKVSGGPEVANAWNFDFDDNESDGADVAAFEYADPKGSREDFNQDNEAPHVGFGRGGREEGFYNRPAPRSSDKEYSGPDMSKPRLGFDDFDDEDDDDLDSYEVDTRNEVNKGPTVSLSELEVDSFSEDDNQPNRNSGIPTRNKPSDLFSDDEDAISHNRNARPQSNYRAQDKASQPRRGGFSRSDDDEVDFGSDDDLPIHPKWKSSRINQRSKARGSMSYGSDNDSDFSDENDFGTKQKKGSCSNRNPRKQQRFDDEGFSDMESDTHGDFKGRSFRGGNTGFNGRGKSNDRDMDRRKGSTRDSFARSSVVSRGRNFEDGDRGGSFRSPRGGGGGSGRSPRGGGGGNSRSPRGGGGGNGRSPRGGEGGNGRSPRGGEGGSYKQREDRFGNSNKQGGDDYDQRIRRPRINVR